MNEMTIEKKFILVFSIFFVVVLGSAYFVFTSITEQQSENVTIELAGRQSTLAQKYYKEYIKEILPFQVRYCTQKSAEIATLQIVEDRKQCTKNIVVKLKKDGIVNVHTNKEYASIDGGTTLPATFVQEVSKSINNQGVYSYKLLSKWNINKDKGLKTDFENEAFNFLYDKKGTVFSRYIDHNGIFVLRYATADIAASASCINCHNNHADSQKKDFRLGDVMGILVVNIPIGPVSPATTAFFSTTDDSGFGKNTFLKTKHIFDTTLGALINGGRAPLDVDMTKFAVLRRTTNPEIASRLNEVQKLWDETHSALITLLDATPDSAEYIDAFNKSYNLNDATVKAINETVGIYTAVSNKNSTMLLWIQGISVGTICLAIGLGWVFFARPLTNSLKELVAKLSDGAEQVSSAAGQISGSNQALAQGSSEQASLLEETSSTMEEMSIMTKRNSSNASEAANLAKKCNDSAEKGNTAVDDMCTSIEKMNSTSMEIVESMSDSMQEINISSNQITEITKVIDGIAFQTNLLALNAAVEAARAGEHGKGFAVVAEEVRNLAQRSANAAKDTAVLIKDCVNKANNGAVLTNKCKDTLKIIVENVKESTNNTNIALQEIVSNVGQVTILTNEISTASCEQSDGVYSVNKSIQQMDSVTQQNAATAEKVASTSEEMSAQAENLLDLVGELSSQVGSNQSRKSLDTKDNTSGNAEIVRSAHQLPGSSNGGNGKSRDIDLEFVIPMGDNSVESDSRNDCDF
jgi:methyl-accepting chemotaxis protein